MTQQELKDKYWSLYEKMASSRKTEYMMAFGRVMNDMMEDMISNNTSKAEEYISRLECIKWNNYLTQREAQAIVDRMEPKAPWTREQWMAAMQQHNYEMDKEPCYNRCALWVTMNMIMSDSSNTLSKYVSDGELFSLVHSLAVDKLTDADKVFNIRKYFNL